MAYLMESSAEVDRLEKQSTLGNYDLSEELAGITFSGKNQRVLDAGCGSGLLSRYLTQNFSQSLINVDACDASDIRIQQAKKLSKGCNINFFSADLEKLSVDDQTYDHVFCRYVLQHFANPSKAISEIFRVLKPGGTFHIIDTDGVLFNIFTGNSELNNMLEQVKNSIPVDMFVGRKLPQLLIEGGFHEEGISYDITLMKFSGIDRAEESIQYRERLTFAMPILTRILGSENMANRFINLYVSEVAKEVNPIFYNKFIVDAKK